MEQRQLCKQTTSVSPTVPRGNTMRSPSQLQNSVMQVPLAGDIASKSKASVENIECPRCKKKCRSRSVFCEKGAHWIHYFCDGLSETDIHRLAHDKGFIYNSKRCLNKKDTVVKRLVCGSSVQPNVTYQTTMPTIPTNHTEGHRSQAEAILDDEGDCVCSVCLEIIIGTQNRCSKCLSVYHDSCIDGASSDVDSGICLSCCATEAQIHQQIVSSQSDYQASPARMEKPSLVINPGCRNRSQLVSDQAIRHSVTDVNPVLNPTSGTDAQGVDIGVYQ